MSEAPRKTASEVADELNSKFDTDHPVVVRGADLQDQTIRRLPTGIYAMDAALGGGWPIKQWSEIYGYESSGKTAVALQTIAANQALDPNFEVVWVAAEEYVAPYARMWGVDNSRVHLIETNVMEEALQRMLAFVEARSVDMAVIDSLPMLVPNEEREKDIIDVQVALQARITGKFFRKIRHAGKRSLIVEDRPVTGIILNQYRANVGGWAPHGQEALITPGGKAKNFAFFTRVELTATETLKHPDKKQYTSRGNTTYIPIGSEVRAKVVKNKSAPEGRIAVFDMYFDDGGEVEKGHIDRGKDLFMTASFLDVIVRKGAYYYFDDGTEDMHQIARGKDKTYANILEDESLYQRIDKEMRERMLS